MMGPGGETVYRVEDRPSGKKRLTILFPNGHASEMGYEIESFHLMPWGYVEVRERSLIISPDRNRSVWTYLHDAEVFRENGLFGMRKDGDVVFPAVAEQIEHVEAGKGVFILKGNRYALLRRSGTSVLSGDYDRDDDIFYEDGNAGWRQAGRVVVPAEFDNVSKWYAYYTNVGFQVWALEKDGRVRYVDAQMRPLFGGAEGPAGKEPYPFPSDGDDVFVTLTPADPSASGPDIILSDSGKKYLAERRTRVDLRTELLSGEGPLVMGEGDLALFDDDCSYELAAYRTWTRSDRPLEDLLSQFAAMGAHTNSWYYLIGIRVPAGYVMDAGQIRHLRHYFETLPSRTLGLKVSITVDPALKVDEVDALMVTFYNESMPEVDWIEEFNEWTLAEILEKYRGMTDEEKKDRGMFSCPFYNIRYSPKRRWRESEKVLDWFRGKYPDCVDLMHSYGDLRPFFYKEPRELRYIMRVIRWALSRGGNPNIVKHGETAMDRVREALSKSWKKDKWIRQHVSEEDFLKRRAVVVEIRDLLAANGAKTLAQLRAEEKKTVPDLETELAKLRKFCKIR